MRWVFKAGIAVLAVILLTSVSYSCIIVIITSGGLGTATGGAGSPGGQANIDTATVLYSTDSDEDGVRDTGASLTQWFTFNTDANATMACLVYTAPGTFANPEHLPTTQNYLRILYGDRASALTTTEWTDITGSWYILTYRVVDTLGASTDSDYSFSVNRQPTIIPTNEFGTE